MQGYVEMKCTICGSTFRMRRRSSNPVCVHCKCKETNKRNRIAKEIKSSDDIRTKNEKRFDNAIECITKQVKDIAEWDKAIRIAEQASEKYGSIPEAIIAILLAKNNISFIPQQRIGKYKVDFCIPEYKTILEVDGEIYHCNERRELYRTSTIKYSLGAEWKIIRIPADDIKNDIKSAIKFISLNIGTHATINSNIM